VVQLVNAAGDAHYGLDLLLAAAILAHLWFEQHPPPIEGTADQAII
jgi:hypothetical protein